MVHVYSSFLFGRDRVESSTPPSIFFFFFSYLRTHEYSHPSVTSIIFAVHFCSNFFFFWPLLPSFMIWLPPSNGNTFPNQHFPPAYTIFQVGSWEFHQSCRENLHRLAGNVSFLSTNPSSGWTDWTIKKLVLNTVITVSDCVEMVVRP